MKLRMTWIGKEAPRIELESETVGDFLILSSMADLKGFEVLGFEKTGQYLASPDWAIALAGNSKHGTLKLLPAYKSAKEEAYSGNEDVLAYTRARVADLEDAIHWVVTDSRYAAPEMLREKSNLWIAKLDAVLNGEGVRPRQQEHAETVDPNFCLNRSYKNYVCSLEKGHQSAHKAYANGELVDTWTP